MPKLDGTKATRQIRARVAPWPWQVPIIGLTGAALPDRLAACRAAGTDACLVNPLKLQALSDALGELVPDPAEGHAADWLVD